MKAAHTFHSVIAIGLLGCATAGSPPSPQPVSGATACAAVADVDQRVAEVYAPGSIAKVEPLFGGDWAYDQPRFQTKAQRHARQLEGASLYVAAPAHTNPAYLERALSCHAASADGAQASLSDPLRVGGVRDVDVRAAGPMFRIDIKTQDYGAGQRVLDAARSLQSSVSVTQLASSEGASRL